MDVDNEEMELLGAGESEVDESNDEFLSTDEVFLCGIQGLGAAAIEGV